MEILNLAEGAKTYTSNAWFLVGSWKAIGDLSTLVDTGRDPIVLKKLETAPKGVGQPQIQQVVLTHCHYDHIELLPQIRTLYKPKVYGFSKNCHANVQLKNGDLLHLADREFEVIHIPGHSQDSICLYCEQDRVIFTGDTPIIINSNDSMYDDKFMHAFANIASRPINLIYPGHGPPLVNKNGRLIRDSLTKLREIRRPMR